MIWHNMIEKEMNPYVVPHHFVRVFFFFFFFFFVKYFVSPSICLFENFERAT
jgi:hypothetical protein